MPLKIETKPNLLIDIPALDDKQKLMFISFIETYGERETKEFVLPTHLDDDDDDDNEYFHIFFFSHECIV